MNPLDLFRAGRNHLPLSPGQRAMLKLVEGFAVAAFVTALPLVADFLNRQDLATMDWLAFARYAVATFLVALLMAALKYCKAHLDPQLAPVAGPVMDAAEQKAEGALRDWGGVPSDVKIEPSVSQVLPAVSAVRAVGPVPADAEDLHELAATPDTPDPELSALDDPSDPFGPDGQPTLVRAAIKPASPPA